MQADDNNTDSAGGVGNGSSPPLPPLPPLSPEDEQAANLAEYALGTLDGDASVALGSALGQNPVLAMELDLWRTRLAGLAGLVGESSAPAQVWHAIQQGLQADAPAAVADPAHTAQRLTIEAEPIGLWRSIAFWRGLSLAGLTSAAALVLMLVLAPQPVVPGGGALQTEQFIGDANLLSVLSTEQGAGIWLVKLDEASGTMRVKVLNPQSAGDDRDFELWLVPGDGGAPRSLGLLPATADHRLAVAPDLRRAMPGAAALAVSVEPQGGSPTGAPTGPVRFTGQVFEL